MSGCLNNKIRMKEDQLLLKEYINTICKYSDFDFSNYSESINRRLLDFMETEEISSATELTTKFHNDELFHMKLLEGVTVRYTSIFRDPGFYLTLRNQVLPYLSTFSNLKIWISGCSTGEEVYSLAILLQEMQMLEATEIVATDINDYALSIAQEGIYDQCRIHEYSKNYVDAGGRSSFGSYYSFDGNMIKVNEKLRKNIIFQKNDLLKDVIPGVFNLILCRNVLFYFNEDVKNAVVSRLSNSLRNYSYLAVGTKERIENNVDFTCIDTANKIYRKVI